MKAQWKDITQTQKDTFWKKRIMQLKQKWVSQGLSYTHNGSGQREGQRRRRLNFQREGTAVGWVHRCRVFFQKLVHVDCGLAPSIESNVSALAATPWVNFSDRTRYQIHLYHASIVKSEEIFQPSTTVIWAAANKNIRSSLWSRLRATERDKRTNSGNSGTVCLVIKDKWLNTLPQKLSAWGQLHHMCEYVPRFPHPSPAVRRHGRVHITWEVWGTII